MKFRKFNFFMFILFVKVKPIQKLYFEQIICGYLMIIP